MEELKRSLYHLFGTHGQILDIVAMKTQKMRGQAFITFKDAISSQEAIKNLQGYPFYDKAMKLEPAKTLSKAFLRFTGNFDEDAERGRIMKEISNEKIVDTEKKRESQEPHSDEPPSKIKKPSIDNNPPGPILLLKDLPTDATDEMLANIFKGLIGFKTARCLPGNFGFIQFETTTQATLAMNNHNGKQITSTHTLNITFAPPMNK